MGTNKNGAATSKDEHAKRGESSAPKNDVLQRAYEQLNEQQRLAVDTIEGPVMCIAGPGTGKTQVVAVRVATILRRTQMRPSNILCLTFSVSGATAMRERLRSLIGADAYGVTVKNFHGFCNDLIVDHPLIFDDWSARSHLSDLERYREVNKIIDQLLPHLALVNRKNPHARTREIIGRISELKREGTVDRTALASIADAYEQVMASKSSDGTKQHQRNILQAVKFREFLELFFRYQQMLRATERYDYEDMILYVLEALRTHSDFLASIQERYQYILVDEFQDTNGAQAGLIECLTTYASGVNQDPNLFVVGDDDQAIYRFQGANVKNILSFHQRFPRSAVISLTVSYRSTRQILDAAGCLIARNTQRLVGRLQGLRKDLTSALGVTGEPPRLLLSQSDRTEPWMIADLIEERLSSGMLPQDIAVLVQTNRELLAIEQVLSCRGIPVQMTGKIDLLGSPLVSQALAILRAITVSSDDAALAGGLGAACFALHPADLGWLYAERRNRKCSLLDLLLLLDRPDAALQAIPFHDAEAVIAARDRLFDLHFKAPSRTVTLTTERMIVECGLLSDSGSPLDLAALQEFFHCIEEWAGQQPNYSLPELLSDLDYATHPEYTDLRLSYNLPHLTEAGVQLMTVHKSKGLEFDVVILANFRDGHWDKRRSPSSINIPEDLLFGWKQEERSVERSQDERRLAYVAMTRARRELLFTCPKELTKDNRVRSVSPSGFFAEAGPLREDIRELRHPEEAITLLAQPPLPTDDPWKAFLRHRLESFTLSATALSHFLKEPRLFLERDLMQVPQAEQPNLIYGSAVHEALKDWALSVQRGRPLTDEEILGSFRAFLQHRAILTEHERRNLLATAVESLPRYYSMRLRGQNPFIHKVEHTIIAHVPPGVGGGGDIPLKGKIDRIDLKSPASALATIIDYKTGRPQSEKQIREGDYFRQLVFYAVLLGAGGSLLKPEKFILDFIGEKEQEPVERIFEITQQEKRDLEAVIQAVWEKIVALDFTPL